MLAAKRCQTWSFGGLRRANSLTPCFTFSRNSASLIGVRAVHRIVNGSGSVREANSVHSAGMSLRCVRSPEAPKMTSENASSGLATLPALGATHEGGRLAIDQPHERAAGRPHHRRRQPAARIAEG